MRWRRGLFRAWIVGTVIWLSVGYYVSDSMNGGHLDPNPAYWLGLVIVPTAILILGSCICWVVAGLKG